MIDEAMLSSFWCEVQEERYMGVGGVEKYSRKRPSDQRQPGIIDK